MDTTTIRLVPAVKYALIILLALINESVGEEGGPTSFPTIMPTRVQINRRQEVQQTLEDVFLSRNNDAPVLAARILVYLTGSLAFCLCILILLIKIRRRGVRIVSHDTVVAHQDDNGESLTLPNAIAQLVLDNNVITDVVVDRTYRTQNNRIATTQIAIEIDSPQVVISLTEDESNNLDRILFDFAEIIHNPNAVSLDILALMQEQYEEVIVGGVGDNNYTLSDCLGIFLNTFFKRDDKSKNKERKNIINKLLVQIKNIQFPLDNEINKLIHKIYESIQLKKKKKNKGGVKRRSNKRRRSNKKRRSMKNQ